MFAEDLAPFFDVAGGFAVDATLGAATIPVHFSNGYESALGGLVESSGPYCVGKASDMPGISHGSTITINAVTYTVTGVEPDGLGVTTLRLRG